MTLFNSLKQNLTNYGYTQEEVATMKKTVENANAKLKEIKFANATKEVKEIQSIINELNDAFNPSDLSKLQNLSARINKLDIADRQLLDLTKYDNVVSSYNQYIKNLENEINSSKEVTNKAFDYTSLIVVSFVSLISLLVIILKKVIL